MKKLLLILSLFALLLSCTKDEGMGVENQPLPEEFTYKVSVDQALKNLDIALANIDGETRSTKRSVKSIERVKASQVMDLTRSADIPQLEDLLYVVSFGEGQGSAVLGADKRVEPIFAILDNTSIHADCFTDKITQNSTPNISTAVSSKKELEGFICNLITESALHQIHDSINIYSPNFDKIKVPTYRKEIIANYKVGPLLDTKWDQDNPYNISCPIINGDTCKAGCVAIAIGQILKNIHHPSPNTINGIEYPWASIEKFEFDYPYLVVQEVHKIVLGDYIRAIGENVNMLYGVNNSTATDYDTSLFLSSIGLINTLDGWGDNIVKQSIINNKPVYTRGSHLVSFAQQYHHAWVVDGWFEYTINTYETTYNANGFPNIETLFSSSEGTAVHCNFGWGGNYDGYYTSKYFDICNPRDETMIESNLGDNISSNSNHTFNFNIKTITF